MDARHFDALARSLIAAGSRRGLLGLLASLPVLGGLFALFDLDETAAKGRRKRRKKAHKHGKGRRRKHHKKCNADSKGKTCSGTCGPVLNNCKKTVDCGSCDCPAPCADCFICREQGPNTPSTCVVDPEQQGQECGDPGQLCQPDGACECDAGSCANPTPICDGSVCVACADTRPCPSGCCDATGACQQGIQNSACGFPGQQCANCQATGASCTDRACVCASGVTCAAGRCCPTASDVCDADDECCTPTTCVAQGKNCGPIPNGCGTGNLACGNCTPGSTTPLCVNNVCTACSPSNACPSGCCASDGRCQAGTADGACGNTGQTCDVCETFEQCSGGSCVPRACGDGGVCIVFATSTEQPGNLGGLNGADGICQNLADNAATPLPGTYKAWLSDDTGSPSTRFVQSTGPYRRVDGVTVANNWTDLTDGALLAPIDKTETGGQVPSDSGRFVWTNTTTSGTLTSGANDCENWTSNAGGLVIGSLGQAVANSSSWTVSTTVSCISVERLYCFQQS